MTVAELRALVAFNDWANARTFDAIGALTADQLTKDLGASFPSVLLTAAHLVGAEWIWLQRWIQAPPSRFPDWVKSPELGDLRERLRAVEQARAGYLAGLPLDGASTVVAFKLIDGTADAQPVDVMVRHVVNHSTYHRGQIAAFLRQLGVKPPSTDLILYARETAQWNG